MLYCAKIYKSSDRRLFAAIANCKNYKNNVGC